MTPAHVLDREPRSLEQALADLRRRRDALCAGDRYRPELDRMIAIAEEQLELAAR